MRRIALYLGMAAAAVVASCSVQEKEFEASKGLKLGEARFFASFEQPAAEEGTKVYVDENLYLHWNADDRISLFNQSTVNKEFVFTGETGDEYGEFREVENGSTATGNAIPYVVALYPYQSGASIGANGLSLTMPAVQKYAEKSFGLGANTMISLGADDNLQFKNMGGYLRVSLYGGVSVNSITLKGNNGEKIAGKANVSMSADGTATLAMAEDASTGITLTCANPVALGATAEESVDFWFVVPPVTFSKGFTVVVNYEGGSAVKSTDKSVTVKRNRLSKMSPFDVNANPPTATTYKISHMWLWGGTGQQYGGTKVIDLLTKPDYFNKEDGRGITALVDNYYSLWNDGTFVNYAGEDARNWWFVYSGSVNPVNGKDVDVRKFYDVLPLSTGKFVIDGSTVTLTKADGTTTTATWVGPGTYEMPNSSPVKSVTITTQALMFEIKGGAESWDQSVMYTDYHAITGNPRALFIELDQMPDGFVVPEASQTTDADFKYESPEFDFSTLPGKWNVYGGNSAPFGIWVLGGSGDDPAFVSPIDKSWCWDDSIWRESDNGLTIKVTSVSGTSATGTTNWWSGNDGKFWNYIWKHTSTNWTDYYETDLSKYYDQIPKGEKEFTIDLTTMTATLGNGHEAKLLTPGVHAFAYGKTIEVPMDCIALAFHLMDPVPANDYRWKDLDRFLLSPLEYVIIFEKTE
ncbi:MAG: hypothetical protein IKV62_08635 [Bacteroidales bacterium]|nr:hypothetical protein [Bacteroidales bacterium]